MKKNFLIFILILPFLIISCEKSEIVEPEIELNEFSILKENNPAISQDFYGEISDDFIYLKCPGLEDLTQLIPTIEGEFQTIYIDGEQHVPNISEQDFSMPLTLELTYNNKSKTYTVFTQGYNLLPIVSIHTENGLPIESKTENIKADFTIFNALNHSNILDAGKIKGRGNATWNYAKKPYKIKFSEKQEPFGFKSNKDWVLLAEANDNSFLRTAFMCEVSKALEIPYTIDFQHVDLYINDEYKGLYIFTEKVEEGKFRVNLDNDGFLFEKDTYYKDEPLYFTTDIFNQHFTFKYPDADNNDIVEGDENFNFINNFMNEVERKILLLQEDSTSTLFEDMIDIESFAKWYLAVEITGNFDPNIFYVLKNRKSKLQMYPLWDSEWSLGLYDLSWGLNITSDLSSHSIWERKYLFNCLFNSPIFRDEVKKQWNLFKNNSLELEDKIDYYVESIKYAQETNKTLWTMPAGKKELLVKFENWEEEINYVKNYYYNRIIFLNSYFTSL